VRARVLILLLGLTACSPFLKHAENGSALVEATARVLLSQAKEGAVLVVDSASVIGSGKFKERDVVALRQRLGDSAIWGNTRDSTSCPDSTEPCGGVRVQRITVRNNVFEIRATWGAVGRCMGSYAATFRISAIGRRSERIEVDEEDFGDCGRR
jgi:hypothetical protein